MILRTPPQRRAAAAALSSGSSPIQTNNVQSQKENENEGNQIVVHEQGCMDMDVPVLFPQDGNDMLCTYQCRQMVKSEVLHDLAIKENEVAELQSMVNSLQGDNTRKELQKNVLEARVQVMEQDLAAANAREKAVKEQYLKEVKQFQELFQKHIKQSSELEMKLQHEMQLRAEAESVAITATNKVTILEEKMKKADEIAQRDISKLESQILKLQKDSEFAVLQAKAEMERETCRASSAEQEVDLLKKQYEELQIQLSESLHKKTQLQQEISNAIKEAQGPDTNENNTLLKHLQEELRQYEAEVTEARILKMFYANAELLREKLLEEKKRADRAEAALEALPELELKVTNLENELKSWRSMINDLPGIESPEDVPWKIAELQKESVGSMAKVGEMALQLKELRDALEKEEHGRLTTNNQVSIARRELEEAMTSITRLERKIALLTKERDGLKAIISSYDEEEAVALKRQKIGDASPLDKPKNKRIQELEAALANSVSSMKQLEQDLLEQGEHVKSQRRKSELLSQELDDALRKIKSLEREGDRLRREISLYESKLGHGDFNVSTTKVLHMVNTLGLDNEKKNSRESLQLELQQLRAKLQDYEELKGQPDNGGSAETLVSEKVSQLKAQIATLEKREERYKKVFAEKISVFRLACCSLFGYKIQMDEQQRANGIPVTMFTLQSIYALSDDEKLEFEYESGNMNLQMNEYTSQPEISREVDVFLHKFHSIPAFTANLTVELFNRSTMN